MNSRKATRDGFGEAIIELGKNNEDVVVLSANMAESTRVAKFGKQFPGRYFEVGVAEQNLAGLGAGLALGGKIPFITSFGAFSPGTNWGQIRTSICYNEANVKIVSTHCGISVGADGAAHQILEDIAIMRVLPNIIVIAPADAREAYLATFALEKHTGPVYLRLGREPVENIFKHEKFEIGKIYEIIQAKKNVIFSTGSILGEAIEASNSLKEEGIDLAVYHCPTIKPIDQNALIKIADKFENIYTTEEHQISGGFGSAVIESITKKLPKRITRIGIRDVFGESGKPQELFHKFGIDAEAIITAVRGKY